MRIKLQASAESPLLHLIIPLLIGLYIGLNFYAEIYLLRYWLLALLGVELSGLFLLQKRVAFQGMYFSLVCCLAMLWASQNRQNLEVLPSTYPHTFQGVILEKPIEKPKTYSVLIQPKDYAHKVLLYINKDSASAQLQTGDFIQVTGKLQSPLPLTSGFDYAEYLKTKGIVLTGYVPKEYWRRIPDFSISATTKLRICAMQLRDFLCLRLEKLIPNKKQEAFIQAILLGNKSELALEQKQAYSATGLSHILALSGMHIGFIVLLFEWLTCWCPTKIRKALTIASTWSYIFLVGLPTSAVRAGLMLTLVLINPFHSQRTMAIDRWALAGILLLVINPLFLQDIGFQLSFAAVGSILLFSPFFKHVTTALPKHLLTGIQLCLCAQLGVLPLTLYHFGTFPLYFLLANVPVSLILTPIVMYLSLSVLLFGNIPFLQYSLKIALQLQDSLVYFIQNLPGAQIHIPDFHAGALLLSYIAIIMLLKYLCKRNSKSIIHLQLAIIGLLICYLLQL